MKNSSLFSFSVYLFFLPLILISITGCTVEDTEEKDVTETETQQVDTPQEETNTQTDSEEEQINNSVPKIVPKTQPVSIPKAPAIDASATVIFPNGRESLQVGKLYEIAWKSEGVSKINIRLEENGYPRGELANNVLASLGKFTWVPSLEQGVKNNHTMNLKVVLTDTATGKVLDESDKTFIIVQR